MTIKCEASCIFFIWIHVSRRSSCPNSLVGLLEANKYKMLMRIPLDDLEVMKGISKEIARRFAVCSHCIAIPKSAHRFFR